MHSTDKAPLRDLFFSFISNFKLACVWTCNKAKKLSSFCRNHALCVLWSSLGMEVCSSFQHREVCTQYQGEGLRWPRIAQGLPFAAVSERYRRFVWAETVTFLRGGDHRVALVLFFTLCCSDSLLIIFLCFWASNRKLHLGTRVWFCVCVSVYVLDMRSFLAETLQFMVTGWGIDLRVL